MTLGIPLIRKGAMQSPLVPGDIVVGGFRAPVALTTAGDGTILAAAFAAGAVKRTGPVGAATDTTDTAVNILAAIAGNFPSPDLQQGLTWPFLYINGVAQAITMAGGTGVTLQTDGSGTNNVAASLVREYVMTVLNNQVPFVAQVVLTSGSKVATFVLPTGVTGLPLVGAQGIALTAGALISGTNITAGTLVDGITTGPGGVTGFHMDTNASGTSASAAGDSLTFGPRVGMRGMRSSTA